jgi:hypothetical protein
METMARRAVEMRMSKRKFAAKITAELKTGKLTGAWVEHVPPCPLSDHFLLAAACIDANCVVHGLGLKP